MKIFLDSADPVAITQWFATGLIDGVTTNPTHLHKQGGNILETIKAICDIMPGCDVSVQVTQSEPEKVYEQAKKIAKIAKNVVVKIPCKKEYYSVIKQLVHEGIPINVTLVFSLVQALYMSKLGVRYISPFVGRLEDANEDGEGLLVEVRHMLDQYMYDTQLLAASLRNRGHLDAAIMAGADVATLPVSLLEESTQHRLTDQGIERFAADWQALGIRQFP